MSKMDLSFARSCLFAVMVTPDSRVSDSEKWPTTGTFRERDSKGKYSEEGRPPPREMMPGLERNLAACFRELPFRIRASWLMKSFEWVSSLAQFLVIEVTHDPTV